MIKALQKIGFIALVSIAQLITRCSNEDIQKPETLKITVKNSEEYQLDLGLQKMVDRPDGIVEATISIQAKHFRKSEVEFVVSGLGLNDNVIYKFLAAENYTGNDSLEITICKKAKCDNANALTKKLRIEFTIIS